MQYETVIGLEVHVQLKTKTKMFCGCSTTFGAPPNSQTCPVCLGLPGSLPVLNRQAVRYALMTAAALNCEIVPYTKFDRKNYFYPDIPKNYQISQYDLPYSRNGRLEIEVDGKRRKIGITRAHMEEDAGKLLHEGDSPESAVDLNRAGTPLLEIVSEPDLRSPEEAFEYLTRLKQILKYIDVSDCEMQEGSLRCDANVSIRPKGEEPFGIRAELKNLNSFRGVQKALTFEVERHRKLLEAGHRVEQETRSWDAEKEVTVLLRSKEEVHDYRYFPEPDLPHLEISEAWIREVRESLPELPEKRLRRFVESFELTEYDAGVITADRQMADFFEAACRAADGRAPAKKVANWVIGPVMGFLNEKQCAVDRLKITPEGLAELLELVEKGTVNQTVAKQVFAEAAETGGSPAEIVKSKGLGQISDESALADAAERVIAEHEKPADDYRSGKKNALAFLVGQLMRATKGKANPQLAARLLEEKLGQK